MTDELAVPFPTSFLLSVQMSPLLCPPSAHHNCTSSYLLGTSSNLGGGGGGGGGGNSGGGQHWQTSWQLSVNFSATGLEHDFWGSPWVICEETNHCMSSRTVKTDKCVFMTWVPEWHLRPAVRSELKFLRCPFPERSPFLIFFFLI